MAFVDLLLDQDKGAEHVSIPPLKTACLFGFSLAFYLNLCAFVRNKGFVFSKIRLGIACTMSSPPPTTGHRALSHQSAQEESLSYI